MKAKEMKLRVVAAVEQGVKEYFLLSEQQNSEILLGGVVLSSPGKLKMRVVDKDYHPRTYLITIEEVEK